VLEERHLTMATRPAIELNAEQCREVAAWIEATREGCPAVVRDFLDLHRTYLAAGEGDPLRRKLEAAWRELRRALHLTRSSEKRRTSGRPLDGLPGAEPLPKTSERERLEARLARLQQLSSWHQGLKQRHDDHYERTVKRLSKMPKEKTIPAQVAEELQPLEEIELTEEQRAETAAVTARLVEHMTAGEGAADPALQSADETLMPPNAVLVEDEQVNVPAQVPEGLAEAKVVKTLCEPRTRYDFAVTVTRIQLDVEKKVLVGADGERHVITGSTSEWGPARFQVTWSALATLATLVAQYALPLNRLGTLLSSPQKRFTAASLGRMLHYVAERLLPVYFELGKQLSNSDYLAGDDTSCRVLELSAWFEKARAGPDAASKERPPWSDYATPSAAEESLRLCERLRRDRLRRREDGDRSAVPTPAETPSLGVLIGKRFPFESLRRNGDGPKEALHTTVITGRSAAADPSSLIVFYRSHLGSCGNLYEALLSSRDPKRKKLVLQGDLSPSNRVTSEKLLGRFDIRFIGCAAHARRPFALYEDEDPAGCGAMLHLFTGLAIHEDQLNVFGRNEKNVRAVRTNESRALWNDILKLARSMTEWWSKATNLGAGARYIINHFDELTAYLDDPTLEADNTARERMLRTEKLIEGAAMFRKGLEGRFVLDVVRTILQTAVASGVHVHEYLVWVLRADEDEIAAHPERFTPYAWAAALRAALATMPRLS
jgi:hypothetical protein